MAYGANPSPSQLVRGLLEQAGPQYTPTPYTPAGFVGTQAPPMSIPGGVTAPTAPQLGSLYSGGGLPSPPNLYGPFQGSVPPPPPGASPLAGWSKGAGGGLLKGAFVNALPAVGTQFLSTRSRASNPALYDVLRSGLAGAQAGAASGNPLIAVGGGVAGANSQLGFQGGRSQTDLVTQALSRNPIKNVDPETAHGLARLGTGVKGVAGILSGNPLGAGETWSAIAPDGIDSIGQIAGSLPVVGGLFGGGEAEIGQASAPSTEDQAAQAQAQAEQQAQYTPENLTVVMGKLGIDPATQEQLVGQFNDALIVAEANPEVITETELVTPDADGNAAMTQEEVDAAKKSGKLTDQGDGTYALVMTPDLVREGMYKQMVAGLTDVKQAQVAEQAQIQKQAALQAALVQMIPQATQPFYDAANTGYATLGQALRGLPANAQAAGQGMINAQAGGSGAMGDALAMQIANQPTYDRMTADMAAAQSQEQQYQQMLMSAQMRQQLQAEYPELFPTSTDSTSGVDALLNQGG